MVRPQLPRQRRVGRPHPKSEKPDLPYSSNRCYREDKVLVKYSTPLEGWSRHLTEQLPKNPKSNGLVRFKVSEKWFSDDNAAKRCRKVPFIDRDGLIHASTVALWKCSSYQLYGTILSTVYKRLRSLVNRVRHKFRPKPNLLLKVAAIYALENNDSWYKRCIAMIFNNRCHALNGHIYYYMKNVDTNKRFLFDQVFQNTLWFQSRVLSPAPRDKSTPCASSESSGSYKQPSQAPCRSSVRNLTLFLNLRWSSVYQVIHEELKYLRSALDSHRPYGMCKSLLLF
jgi:hypothetical protein